MRAIYSIGYVANAVDRSKANIKASIQRNAMKTLIGVIALLCLSTIPNEAQSLAPTKIHFLNTMVGFNAELKMTVDQQNPLVIKNRTWVIIRTTSDSLGFVIDSKPHFIHFDPHKQYYFLIQGNSYSRPIITAISEQEFILSASISSIKGPEEHDLTKVSN